MKLLIAAVDLILWILQGILMIAIIVPLQRVSMVLMWIAWKVIRYPYYQGLVLPRRYLTKRPLWQDSDLMLGIQPPPGELERLMKIVRGPS